MERKIIAKNLLQGKLCTNCLKGGVCIHEQPGNNTCADWESRIVYGPYIPVEGETLSVHRGLLNTATGKKELEDIKRILDFRNGV